ncbi:hypothetical protein Ae201684P_018280 [Aphanomyces euteiches]|uniref:Uncharacterized protein n=1 Tax=Aphanomyces euteiches TaxID=100861 RepID=A0A6G0WZP5_9STRA|nr:hypothetical protein Ae201684_010081 [Aphanomyces euteiches]KAH9099263.1 hypothetical protein Ae201684P_018280 [Aphanomyces euteiches]
MKQATATVKGNNTLVTTRERAGYNRSIELIIRFSSRRSRMPQGGELEERLSYRLSGQVVDDKGDYVGAKSPSELEDGAIMEGGALHLFSREAMGLFSQYFAIGVLYGMIPALKYPIYNVYLGMEPYQVSTYAVLVNMGWSFKVFFGMLTDCIPIFGYRRKPWMLIGWIVAIVCLITMISMSIGEPYCNRATTDSCGKPFAKVNATDLAANYNLDAPNKGSTFIMLSILVSFGYVCADVAADAMVVQYAQREPVAIRGRVQTAIYVVRYIGSSLAVCVTAFGLNGVKYGGSFSFSMAPTVPYGLCLIPCVMVMFTTIFVVVEKKSAGSRFVDWWVVFWQLLQQRVMWQICAFRFMNNVFNNMSTTADNGIATYWAHVEPINDSLQQLLAKVIFGVILVIVGKWGLNWNWRWIIATTSLAVVFIDMIVQFLVTWDVVRNQWFYTGVALSENIPDGVRFIVSAYCAVEIADPGNEGATYGLVTTVSNLASPFASVIYKYINSYLKLTTNDFKTDSTEVRWDVTYAFIIAYCCKVFALVFLFMLPPQKKEMQELKRTGGKSKLAGALLVIIFIAALSFSMTSSIMSIFPSTKCYRIAGGNGKLDPNTGKCPK